MSMWGAIWTSAMGQAFNEAVELETGARLARRMEQTVEMAPGSITLRDPDEKWIAQLGLRQLDDGQWETLLRTVAADPLLTAAVVTGELPIELHGKAVALGCSFAPEAADVGVDCSCPDWHEPCRHVGALIALVAEMVDADPWLLVMLRGRSRDQVGETVRRLRSANRGIEWAESGDEPRGADPGVAAAGALRASAAPIPSPLPPLRRAAEPTAYRPPPADAGVAHGDLRRLVADAAQRSFDLLGGAIDGDGLTLDPAHDAARIATSLDPDDPAIAVLAAAAELPVDELRLMGFGWDLAGPDGVDIVASPQPFSAEQVARATAAIPDARAAKTSVTAGTVQLRIDRQGRWWRFVRDDEFGWIIADGPVTNPSELLN